MYYKNRIALRTASSYLLARLYPTLHITALISLFIAFISAAHIVSAQEEPASATEAKVATVSHQLQQDLNRASGPVSFLAVLRDQPNPQGHLRAAGIQAAARQTKAAELYHYLTTHARQSQADLRAWLDAQEIEYEPFYIVNMIEIYGDASVVEALQQHLSVARLEANPLMQQQLQVDSATAELAWLPWLTQLNSANPFQSPTLPYGLTYTHAPDVWAMGYRGQGIVVASQDTGVQWDHPALKARYRGTIQGTMGNVSHVYNWFDAWSVEYPCASDPQVPCDDHGHGTHTVGTMVGDDTPNGGPILGMAPDASWIGCRNMHNGDGTPASYAKCFQFFLAPYPQGGDPFTDGRPELAPNIINNSWGCPQSEGCRTRDELRQIVETVRAAGQMVVASAGNDGFQGCQSVQDPIAIYDATFSVGAHDSGGNIASFSSRGPVTVDGSRRAKPDMSAPGVGILSAWRNGGQNTISGTSMASPHVAGAVALLWSAVPTLTGQIDLTEKILTDSANPFPLNGCGEEGTEPVSPNYTYGHGRLNVLAAVQQAQQLISTPVTVTIRVTNWDGQPASGAQIRLVHSAQQSQYEATTDEAGKAQIVNVTPGDYWLHVYKEGTYFDDLLLTLVPSSVLDVQRQGKVAIFLPLISQEASVTTVP